MRRARSVLLTVAACAFAATTAPVSAATWDAGRLEPEALALAGDHVEWLAPLPKHRVGLFYARHGYGARRLQSFAGSRRYWSVHPAGFAVSPRAVVLARGISFSPPVCCGYSQHEYFLGPTGGRLGPDGRCETGSGGGVDVHDATIVRVRCDRRIEIRDLDSEEPPVVVGRSAFSPAIAGRYVAWIEGDYNNHEPLRTVLYDRWTGSEVYRLVDPPKGRRMSSVDVQDDGTLGLVVTYGADTVHPTSRIGWSSLAAPGLRVLPLAHRRFYRAEIAANRIAFIRRPKSDSREAYEVGTADLHGDAHLVTRRARSFIVAFDGRRVAYVRRRDRRYEIVVDRPGGSVTPLPGDARRR